MKRILCISGSRADYGLLEWPVKVLRESFEVRFDEMRATDPGDAFTYARDSLVIYKPDCLLILGDRWEILQAAIAAHLQRVPIAHLCGGDMTRGSYDDAMRDCISRMATWHFATSPEACQRVEEIVSGDFDLNDIHMIGNIALDYIMHVDWKRERPYQESYVVVSYQAETIDGVTDFKQALRHVGDRLIVVIRPNPDAGSDKINADIDFLQNSDDVLILENMPRGEFLNLLYHADEFIGNSSAMLYEAPALGVKCRMIGRRQEGRVAPTGDGRASERIKEVLCRAL